MAKSSRLWAFAIVAVIVVWLFAFGGLSLIMGLFVPSSSGQPTSGAFDTSISSVSDGGNGVIQVSSSGQSASISGSKATLAGESTVTISMVVRQSPPSAGSSNSFQMSLSANPSYTTSGGAVFKLMKEDPNGCPTITYSMTGDGTGVETVNPCGFYGSLGSGQAMTVTAAISVNPAFFTNSSPPAQYPLVIHTSGGNDVTLTWIITG